MLDAVRTLFAPEHSKTLAILGYLVFLSLVFYLLIGEVTSTRADYFPELAQSFLHGRLYIETKPDYLDELVGQNGKYYVVYPPLPAVVEMPFVAIFSNFSQPFLSTLIGVTDVLLGFLVMQKIFKNEALSLWMGVLYAFGSMQWFHSGIGSAWYIAHILTELFIWLMIWEVLSKKRLFIIGLLIGAAYWSRLPAILAVIFPLTYLSQEFFQLQHHRRSVNIKNLVLMGLGIAPFLIANVLYNYLRFGVIYDIAYSMLPVFHEPWYRYGLFNIRYIPVHLQEIFTALPRLQPKFPFLIPSKSVLALWFVTPAFLLLSFSNFKNKTVMCALLTVLAMALPGLLHGSNGSTQFGFRFALDYLPFLLILTASGFQRFKWSVLSKALVIFSILVNLWGITLICLFGIYTL